MFTFGILGSGIEALKHCLSTTTDRGFYSFTHTLTSFTIWLGLANCIVTYFMLLNNFQLHLNEKENLILI